MTVFLQTDAVKLVLVYLQSFTVHFLASYYNSDYNISAMFRNPTMYRLFVKPGALTWKISSIYDAKKRNHPKFTSIAVFRRKMVFR